MKSSLAGMVYAAGLFKVWGRRPGGDVVVCGAGLEELGGWGSHLLLKDGRVRAERAVVGEPTGNRLFLGHRGRIILQAQLRGRSTHGSVVDYEANPLLSLARFLDGLPGLAASLAERASYLTMAPTALSAAPAARNVTPAEVVQTLDVRVGPGIEAERVRQAVGGLLQSSLGTGCSGQVVVARQQVRTHTGVELDVEDVVPGYELAASHAWAGEARAVLSAALGRDVGQGEIAGYACDAVHLYQGAGIPTIIFGPGDIGVAHTNREHIPVEQVLEAVVGMMGLVA
jgi:acetylornithine deacetylase/succinyl-diaminopimelate desuccinylase-like protein